MESESLIAEVLGEGFWRHCCWNSVLKLSSTEGAGKTMRAPEFEKKPGMWQMVSRWSGEGGSPFIGRLLGASPFPQGVCPLTLTVPCKAGINFIPFLQKRKLKVRE